MGRLRAKRLRLARIVLAAALAGGGARADDPAGDLEQLDRGLYEMSGAVAPRHPVTGRPVLNVVPESLEIRLARDFFRQYAEEAAARGAVVDPPGRALERTRRVFSQLVAVAHRPQLPWEVHWVEDPTPNAFTAGGGLVVVLSGLVGAGLLREGSDEDLAVVLAHEIAHVAMLHPPTRVTWLGVGSVVSPDAKDPYYQAAYTFDQETEADRLSVLYLALAGYDPFAAPRLWARAAEEGDASRGGYLNDHPVSRQRVAITREAASRVERYRRAGRRNPRHAAIRADNVLYPRQPDDGYHPGDGLLRAGTAILDSFRLHQRAAQSRDERRASVHDLGRVRVIGSWPGRTADGEPGLVLDVWNGGARAIAELNVVLAYWTGGAMILIEDCNATVRIPPQATGTLTCPRQPMEADRIEPRVSHVAWR